MAWRLLEHEPDRATSLGVDTGAHAALRGQLEDTTPAGQAAYAATLREDLARVSAVDEAGLDPTTRTSLEVVKSAYANALEGFALPYGDVAVGSWRNAPYVVIQNVGGYLDLPRALDSDQPLRDGADVDYYMQKLAQVPAALDGELTRMRSAREMGLVPPDFLLDKAIGQMEQTIADTAEGGGWVIPLDRSELTEAEAALPHAVRLAQSAIAPALAAQLEELKAERALATSEAGMWSRPPRRRLLSLGLAGEHHHRAHARRGPRAGPRYTCRYPCHDGPDPALARLYRGHGRPAHEAALAG